MKEPVPDPVKGGCTLGRPGLQSIVKARSQQPLVYYVQSDRGRLAGGLSQHPFYSTMAAPAGKGQTEITVSGLEGVPQGS